MSNPLDELFSDEISELQKHVKSEEEINKYSTQDDLGEVRRAIFILKKGYQSQKVSIIENMDKVMTEAGANEDFLPIILCSMEIWDMTMQQECAKSFKRDSVLSLMSPANHVKLTDELLNIIFGADVTQEEFVNEWLLVFKNLCGYLNLEYIRYTVVKRIAELPSLKQTLPWRKIGFEMFWSLAMAKGEELLKNEPLMMKTIVSMCTDNNWRIRREAAKYLKEFLSELNKWKQVAPMKPSPRKNEPRKSKLDRADSHVFSALSPKGFIRKQIEAKQVHLQVPAEKIDVTKIKLSKEKFREEFYDIMAELLSDRELLVRIEGIDMFIEYQDFLTREDFERDFVPHLMETLEMLTKDDSADDEAEIRMIRNLGPIADRLSQFGILRVGMSDDMRLEKTFIEYFKSCMAHPVMNVRKGAAYNLPCFFLYFRFWEPNLEASFNEFDDSRSFLDRFYQEVCQDPETSVEMLTTLASGIHEVMQLFTQDLKLPSAISESLRFLFNTQHLEVKLVLAENIDQIIKYYLRKEDQKQLIEEIKAQAEEQKKGDCGGGVRIVFAGKKPLIKEGSASNLNDEMRIGSPKRKQAAKPSDKPQNAFNFSQKDQLNSSKIGEQPLVPLVDTLDIAYCPEEWQHEYVFSRLLDQMMPLIDSIFNDKTKWRIQALFIRNFGSALQYFNSVELQELIYPKVLERMKSSNDQVKQSGAWFIANLIANQYRCTQRQALIDTVVNDLGRSKTFALRKCFIMCCVSAVQVLSFETFKQHFFSLYLKMAEDKIADVRISFLNSAVEVRPYLEQDPTSLNEFNLVLSTFLMDQSPTIFELTNQVDMKLLRLKRSINLAEKKAEDAQRVAFEQKLKERDLLETEARLLNGGDKKSKIELVTIYHFSNLLKKNRGNPILFGGSAAIAGMFQPGLAKKQTVKTKKQPANQASSSASTTPTLPPGLKVPGSSATPPPSDSLTKLPSSQSLVTPSIIQELTTAANPTPSTNSSTIENNGSLSTTLSATISKFKKKLGAKKENNASILPPITQSSNNVQQQVQIKSTPVRKVDISLTNTLNAPLAQQQNSNRLLENGGRLTPLGGARQQSHTANQTLDNGNSSQDNILEPTLLPTSEDMKYESQSKLPATTTGRYGGSMKRGPPAQYNPHYHSNQQFHQNMKERLSTNEPISGDPTTPQAQEKAPQERQSEMPSEVKHILWKNSIANTKPGGLNPNGSLTQFQMMSNGLGSNQKQHSTLNKRRVSSEDFENMTTQVSFPISNPTTSSKAKRNPQVTLTNLSQEEPQTVIIDNTSKFPQHLAVQNGGSIIRQNQKKPPLQVQFTSQVSPQNGGTKVVFSRLPQQASTNHHFFNSPQASAITNSIIQGTTTPQTNHILPPLSQILSIRSTNKAKATPKLTVDLSDTHYYSNPTVQEQSNLYESQKRAQSSGGQGMGVVSLTQDYQRPEELTIPQRNQQHDHSQSALSTGYNEKMRLNMFSVANQQQSRMVTTTLNFKYGLTRQSTFGNTRNIQQMPQKPQGKSVNNEAAPPMMQSLHKPQQFKTQQQRRETCQSQMAAEQQKIASAIVRRIVSPKEFRGQHTITSQLLVKGNR